MKELQLGKQSALPESPDKAILDVVPNPVVPLPGQTHVQNYCARFTAPEFTSLCPVTGQPDFARLWIDYVPDRHLIESKSLKLFLGSFRNHGAFHEACTMEIGDRLYKAARPHWMRLVALWYPRGGIPIDVFWHSGPEPHNVLIPDMPKLEFAGR